MRRLRTQELAILITLLPVWALCLALFTLDPGHARGLRIPFLLHSAQSAADYPVVAAHRPDFSLPPDGPAVGARVLRYGDTDLRGAGAVRAWAVALAETLPDRSLPVVFEDGGQTRETVVHLTPEAYPWRIPLLVLGFGLTAVLVILRAPDSRVAQAFLPASLVWTLTWIQFQGSEIWITYAFVAERAITGCLWAPLILRTALLFPENVRPRSEPLPRWPWIFAALGLTWTSRWFDFPLPISLGTVANATLGALYIVTLLLVLARNYRRADPVGRRQVRWVVYGVYVGSLPVLVAIVTALVEPSLWWLWDASTTGLAVIPIFIFLAITRSNFLDVDRIISVTASYTLLLVVLAVAVLAAAPALARTACELVEAQPEPCTPAVSALVAVALVLLHGALRPRLERSFFAERHALQSQFETLLALLSSARDPETLMKVVGERLDDLLRPECCVLYGRAEPVFAPVFVRGRVVPTAFEMDGALARILAERSAPLDLEREGLDGLGLGAAERSALESLGASTLLPVSRGDTLAGFICLGPKRSGDVYTGTDLTLLAALASRISSELLRFGEQQLLREARALEGRLRRYVPASVRSQLARGAELEAGEREVSVLFVDIRGYASYAEGRGAEEIFSTVNRYTEAVSSVVTEHSGSIVEFNGDGLMAVFGAPEPLAAKERCALEAGREMVARVRALSGAGQRIEVGVGIATGSAYVGPIRAVDRLIWSAIGNTTNLAARLQALTRELRAAVVIDHETWRRGGHAAAAFVLHQELPIRGLQERRDVHALAAEQV